jgi:hypothetical protein
MKQQQLGELIAAAQKKLTHERCVMNISGTTLRQKMHKNAKMIHEMQEVIKIKTKQLQRRVAELQERNFKIVASSSPQYEKILANKDF